MAYSSNPDVKTIEKRCKKINEMIQWAWLPELAEWVLEQAIAIQQIPAPTFHEDRRAAYVSAQFEAMGLEQVEIDDVFNVYGLLPGADRERPGLMLMAHTDTVFSAETSLDIQHEAGTVYGPGLGDNSIGVAGMLGLLWALRAERIVPPVDVWFVATSREEGLGDLGGVKAAFDRLQARIDRVINIEGLAFGHIYHGGIAVRRLRIQATAPGGHSWLHFGRASALHTLVELGTRILALDVPQNPRTTYNIGMMQGGHAINAIATDAEIWLDMRSEDPDALAELEKRVRAEITTLNAEAVNATLTTEVVGDRPAGVLDAGHPLVLAALAALEQVGMRGTLETGSTDANVPLAQGCPAVTVGITRGGNAHRLDEFVDIEPIADGMRQLIILALTALQADPAG